MVVSHGAFLGYIVGTSATLPDQQLNPMERPSALGPENSGFACRLATIWRMPRRCLPALGHVGTWVWRVRAVVSSGSLYHEPVQKVVYPNSSNFFTIKSGWICLVNASGSPGMSWTWTRSRNQRDPARGAGQQSFEFELWALEAPVPDEFMRSTVRMRLATRTNRKLMNSSWC